MTLNPYIYPLLDIDTQKQARYGVNSDIHKIIRVVCDKLTVPVPYVMSKSRVQSIVECRFICMYLFRKLTTMTLQQIADIFKCNHSLVIHAIKKVNDRIDFEKGYKQKIDEIISVL